MAIISGSIESVSIGGRIFSVLADASVTRSLGGYENSFEADGSGQSGVMTKTRKPWMIEGLQILLDDFRGDHEFLQDLANSSGFFSVAIVYPSGAIWNATGNFTGEIKSSSDKSTATVNMSGPGQLRRQS